MYLDAANTRSYPRTGNTWYDLTGNGNNVVFGGAGPTFDASWTGVISLDGTVSGSSSGPNYSTGTSTVMCASRYNGATRGRIISGYNTNWLVGHWQNSTENYYAVGWVTTSGKGPNDTNWRIYAATGDSVADSWDLVSVQLRLVRRLLFVRSHF
jgi:hypothetical protein